MSDAVALGVADTRPQLRLRALRLEGELAALIRMLGDFTSQEMYGEGLRATLGADDFDRLHDAIAHAHQIYENGETDTSPNPIVLDNTTFYEAADALEREAETVLAHAVDDGEVVSILRESAKQLRDAAMAAECGQMTSPGGWPAIAVLIQGVAEDSELRCQALRGPESYQPTCTLPIGHDGPHRWGRAREKQESEDAP